MIKAEQVKSYRKALNMSQRAFAVHCGVSEQLVRLHWEKDGIKDKDVKKARAILEMINND